MDSAAAVWHMDEDSSAADEFEAAVDGIVDNFHYRFDRDSSAAAGEMVWWRPCAAALVDR